ncbi:MAG TPA: response regulator transcription factor, partial [Planctomycetaceae bacterium]|nr:response regulator transcription factor [Planctomycetaceae bacterium]
AATQPSGTPTKRILIVDDHPIVREGLTAVLSHKPGLEVCGEAATIVEALALIDTQQPDLAIIDLSLSDGSGLELIKRIRARDVPTKMLVLSMSDESLYAERSLRAGAMGFLHKQEARGKLLDAIRQVLDGKIFVSPAINERLLQQVIVGKQPLQQSPITALSDRELEVFELIGQGLGSHEIAHRLHLGIKTVETHRMRIKKKLDLKNSLELVRHATQWVLENG